MQIKYFKLLFLPGILLLTALACSFLTSDPPDSPELVFPATSPAATLQTVLATPTTVIPTLPGATSTSALVPTAPASGQASITCAASWFFTFEKDHLGLASFCPEPVQVREAIGQDFEGGRAYRYAPDPSYTLDQRGTIFVIYNNGEWVTFPDNWDSSQPSSDPGLVVPEGRYQPVDSIGKVWRDNPLDVRNRLGWAYEPQSKFTGRLQYYLIQPGQPSGDNHFSFIDHGKWGLVLLLNSVDMGPNKWEVVGSYP